MHLYPAIDVRSGRAARAGPDADPVSAARALAAAGVAWAHVVDLDRALGTGRDDATVRAVIGALAGVRVQLGGALVDRGEIAEAIGWGATRVVLGSGAVSDLGRLAAEFGGSMLALTVSPTTRHELPSQERAHAPEDLVGRAVESGVATVVYRDRDRDGTLSGADLDTPARLLGRGADLILAGGIASLDELRRARDLGFAGVIVGRALLQNRFTLAEAIACCG